MQVDQSYITDAGHSAALPVFIHTTASLHNMYKWILPIYTLSKCWNCLQIPIKSICTSQHMTIIVK